MAQWPKAEQSSRGTAGSSRSRVLVVDGDEAVVVALLHMLLQDNERVDALAATSFEIARQILSENRIDLIITEMQLPGHGDGLDLLRWIARECPCTRAIGMAAQRTDRVQPEALALGCAKFVRKPLDMKKLRGLIGDVLSAKGESFHGSLSQLTPADVIQMLCLGCKTTALRVMNGAKSGMVYIDRGEITHAQWADLSGEDALYEILSATEGDFHAIPSPSDCPRTITGGWQHLLLESMRRQDESTARMDVSEAEDMPTSPDTTAGAETAVASARAQSQRKSPKTRDVASLIGEGFDAMRLGDLDTARSKWTEAQQIDPSNRIVDLNLRRLESMTKR